MRPQALAALALTGIACTRPGPLVEAADRYEEPRAPVGPSVAGGTDSGTDSAPPRSRVVVHPRHGAADDDRGAPRGPGLLLDSGAGTLGPRWMQGRLGGEGRGDLVIVTAGGGDEGGSFLAMAPFASAQTVALPDDPTGAEFDEAAAIVARAEAIWFPGGDQARYVRWKGSSLFRAVSAVYGRGGVVGGTSAGMILLGGAVNDAFNTISENITSAVCLADPFDGRLHFTPDLFGFRPLAGAITDPHFAGRDRMGRLVTFMARQTGGAVAGFRGVAVDDGAALAIDGAGVGVRLATAPGPNVYVVDGGLPTTMKAGAPLRYEGLTVVRLADAAASYRFFEGCGTGHRYTLTVDGGATPWYSTDPYTSGVFASSCP